MMATTLRSVEVDRTEVSTVRNALAGLPDGSPLLIAFEGILDAAERGEDITVFATDKDLTTTQVANLLKVSRPFVTKLMTEGLLASHLVGSHRRCTMSDVLDYIDRHERTKADFTRATRAPRAAQQDLVDHHAPLSDSAIAEVEALGFN
ncbi:helix-turn-helix domain-containing protein [Luteococcus sediminum]